MRIPLHSAPVILTLLLAGLCSAPCLAQKPKSGYWNSRSDIPKGWVVHETRHYQVQSQIGPEKAKRLGKHMETMLELYVKMFPIDRSLKQFPIKLFENRGAFRAYGGSPGAAAYYSASDREMVCYDTGKWMDEEDEQGVLPTDLNELLKMSEMDLLGVAAHEGWHQYFHRYITSWVPIPSWINEGMGDYFYCAKPRKRKDKKLPAELGRLNEARLPAVRWAVQNKQNVPLKDLLHYSQQQYYARAGICYAQGWALCHFLLQSEKPEYRRVIPHFIKLVRNDTNMQTVTEKAFRGIDIDKLEEELNAWVLATRSPFEEQVDNAIEKAKQDAIERAKKQLSEALQREGGVKAEPEADGAGAGVGEGSEGAGGGGNGPSGGSDPKGEAGTPPKPEPDAEPVKDPKPAKGSGRP